MNSSLLIPSFMIGATLALATPTYAASASATVDNAVQDAKTKLYELFDKNTATVAFATGSAKLTKSEEKNLADVVAAMRHDHKFGTAVIAAWSDEDYPARQDEHLSLGARQLADARAASVEKALSNLHVTNIERHSMAERPTWLAKTFNGTDAVVKGAGHVDDANDQASEDLGNLLRKKGGPSKVVVVIEPFGFQAAH